MNDFKVYVWHEFQPDYKNGLAVVIAKDINEAQELLAFSASHCEAWGPVTEYPLDAMAFCVHGGS